MCLLFQQKFNIEVSTSTMCDSLKRLDLTRKKTFHDPKTEKPENKLFDILDAP
jgi:hypothetical protein